MGDVTTRAPFFSLKFPDGQFKRGASLETRGGQFPLVTYRTGQHQRPFFCRTEVIPAGSRGGWCLDVDGWRNYAFNFDVKAGVVVM